MVHSMKSAGWTTTVNHTRVEMSYTDCFLLNILREHSEDVGGTALIPATIIFDAALDKFGEQGLEISELIEESKSKLSDHGLVEAKESRGTVYIRLTSEGMSVAKRLDKHVAAIIPLLDACSAFDEKMFLTKTVAWTIEQSPVDVEQTTQS